MRDGEFCYWHDPKHAVEVAEARRLGGLRRRREATVSGAYDFEGLGSVGHIRRLVEVAVLDTLGLENSIARAPCARASPALPSQSSRNISARCTLARIPSSRTRSETESACSSSRRTSFGRPVP